MGLIYHAALENSLMMCFMDSPVKCATSGILPVSGREQNEVEDF